MRHSSPECYGYVPAVAPHVWTANTGQYLAVPLVQWKWSQVCLENPAKNPMSRNSAEHRRFEKSLLKLLQSYTVSMVFIRNTGLFFGLCSDTDSEERSLTFPFINPVVSLCGCYLIVAAYSYDHIRMCRMLLLVSCWMTVQFDHCCAFSPPPKLPVWKQALLLHPFLLGMLPTSG